MRFKHGEDERSALSANFGELKQLGPGQRRTYSISAIPWQASHLFPLAEVYLTVIIRCIDIASEMDWNLYLSLRGIFLLTE